MDLTDPQGTGQATTPTPPPPTGANTSQQMLQFEALSNQIAGQGLLVKRAAGWFYTVAVLSVINSVISLAHAKIYFLFGLGITAITDAFCEEGIKQGVAPQILPIVAIVCSLIAAGVYAVFGYFGSRRAKWALYLGLALYIGDALLVLLFKDWLGAAFHAYVVFRLVQGVTADNAATKLEAQLAQLNQNPRI